MGEIKLNFSVLFQKHAKDAISVFFLRQITDNEYFQKKAYALPDKVFNVYNYCYEQVKCPILLRRLEINIVEC